MSTPKDFFGGAGSLAPKVQENSDDINLISNPNLFINGDFRVIQRGTFGNLKEDYPFTIDRFIIRAGSEMGGTTHFLQSGHDKYGIQISITHTGATFSNGGLLQQKIEGNYTNRYLQGKRVTYSINCEFENETPCRIGIAWRDKINGLVSPAIYSDIQSIKSDNRYTFTLSVPTITRSSVDEESLYLSVDLEYGVNTVIKNGKYLFSQAKFELGDRETPFISDDPATSLAKCQRYFWSSGTMLGLLTGTNGQTTNPSTYKASSGQIQFPMIMRKNPSMSWSGRNNEAPSLTKIAIRRYHAETIYAYTVQETQTVTEYGFTFLTISNTESGYTTGGGLQYIPSHVGNGATGVIFHADAEL